MTTNATLVRRLDLTASVARFWIRPDDGVPDFTSGQYFALGLSLDGRLLQRPYSTASSRGTVRSLEFLIRLVAGGMLTPRLWMLPVGARLSIGRPKGLFMMRPGDVRTHLFVATGTGLAPIRSMLDVMLGGPGGPSSPRAIVVHGVAYAAELAYRADLERRSAVDPRLTYAPVVSRPGHPENIGWQGLTGRIDGVLETVCERSGLDAGRAVAYLCGNPAAIAAASATLVSRGFAAGAIVTEHYWPIAAAPSPPG